MRFNPTPNQKIRLFETDYYVQAHPEVERIAFVSEGKKADVVQVRNDQGDLFALKVFKKIYRTNEIIESDKHLEGLQTYQGMQAAKRNVILPDNPIVQEFYELEYAVLMPWLKGQTWFDILHKFRLKQFDISKSQAITVCKNFLGVISNLESAGVAHTDISSGNVMIDFETSDVQLLDLEDIFIPRMPPPNKQNIGSIGYQHISCENAQSYWCAEGDRYSSTVLAGEILLLSNPAFADLVKENSFFEGNRGNSGIDEKYQKAKIYLKSLSPKFAAKFDLAWRSEKLQHCNPIASLYSVVSEMEQMAKPRVNTNSNLGNIVTWSNVAKTPSKSVPETTPITAKPVTVKPASNPPITPVSNPSPTTPYWSRQTKQPTQTVRTIPQKSTLKFLGVGISAATAILALLLGLIGGLYFLIQNYQPLQPVSNANKNNLNVNIPVNIANISANNSMVNTTLTNSISNNQNSKTMQNFNVNKSNSNSNVNTNSNLNKMDNKSYNSLSVNSAYYDWCVMKDNSTVTNDNNTPIGELNSGDRIKKLYQDANDKRWFFIESQKGIKGWIDGYNITRESCEKYNANH